MFAYFFVWNLAMAKSNSIFYNTAIKENAWNFSSDLRHLLLENDLLHWIFPELPRQEKDFKDMTKSVIQHNRVRMDFLSLETTQASKHTIGLVNDDLENEKNHQTEGQRESLKSAWMHQKAVHTRVLSKKIGWSLDVGTPYHIQGLPWMIHNNPKYAKFEIPCYIDRDKTKGSSFPERYQVSDFEDIEKDMTRGIFSAQYLLNPLAEADALCPEKWIQHWTSLPDNRWRCMVLDPGGAEVGSSDPTGITICDFDENGNMYIVFADEFNLTPMNFMQKIWELKGLYKPDDIRVEKEKYSITIADLMRHHFPTMRVGFVEHKHRSKESRIWRLKQWFENKKIFLNPVKGAFYNQLIEYPSSRYDDMLDSLSYQIDVMRVPSRTAPRDPNIDPEFEKEIDAMMEGDKEMEKENDRFF